MGGCPTAIININKQESWHEVIHNVSLIGSSGALRGRPPPLSNGIQEREQEFVFLAVVGSIG